MVPNNQFSSTQSYWAGQNADRDQKDMLPALEEYESGREDRLCTYVSPQFTHASLKAIHLLAQLCVPSLINLSLWGTGTFFHGSFPDPSPARTPGWFFNDPSGCHFLFSNPLLNTSCGSPFHLTNYLHWCILHDRLPLINVSKLAFITLPLPKIANNLSDVET